MARNIPGAKKVVIPGAHISNCENPVDYNKAVSAFLKG
jgi:pimeloyl-ACP methyl ester carboxylesterase